MGLSWVVRGAQGAAIEVACTLGGYRKEEKVWRRHPRAWVHSFPLEIGQQRFQLDPLQAELMLRCRQRKGDLYQVSLFLVHRGWDGKPSRNRTERLIFQPQLRVCLAPELQCVGLWELESESGAELSEESRLRLLYRESPVLARGHLCAAVWKAIDPQPTPPTSSPWEWCDGLLLPPADRERFQACDLRSEFLPALAVQSPRVDWRPQYGAEPQRSAEALSQCFSPTALQAALQPLLDGYSAWIRELAGEISTLESRYQPQARHHQQLCLESLNRMQAGLELLLQDSQARLAFCFAQKALALQAQWKGVDLIWRPFQLGFWLQTLQGITHADHPDRQLCDLLWFPTGGGKTEAYLGIVAYLLGLRRLRGGGFDGTGVISRYTLRLLSIQQFRRALGLVTACEFLRVQPQASGQQGWAPPEATEPRDWLWGQHRFCTGLWVGNNVTPNRLDSIPFPDKIPGALDLLQGSNLTRGHGEPAQVLDCPCCGTVLATADEEEGLSQTRLYLLVKTEQKTLPPVPLKDLSTSFQKVLNLRILPHPQRGTTTLVFDLEGSRHPQALRDWWEHVSREWSPVPRLLCAQPGRPGYFLLHRHSQNDKQVAYDFAIYCPNPDCSLNSSHPWQEELPHGQAQAVPPGLEGRIPIPAQTCDDQIYARPPSLLLATVDKFARLAYEPRAATLFGNLEYFHPNEGYYRAHCFHNRDASKKQAHPAPIRLAQKVLPAPPPELILQDELHLIDGPLGSMVGLYEAAVDRLCSQAAPPKYIASTATVREAREQVQCLFHRQLRQFPPAGLRATDSFFALLPTADPFQVAGCGRLYIGLCAPGRGALTPLVRCWASLLQSVSELPPKTIDGYCTPVGYFNSINQLALVGGMWRQFIPQRIQTLTPHPRELGDPIELSSRVESERLPLLLRQLETPHPGAAHGVLATSMFGTGVDVPRLSLMVVHGQPKTTSSYIQATGRVGRQHPGLIITALQATRPRELNHYEYFAAYHLQLYRGVEPVTVFPFAPRARERGLGPLCVALLRQQSGVDPAWRERSEGAALMASQRSLAEVQQLVDWFVGRSQAQPELRRPNPETIECELNEALDRWQSLAQTRSSDLWYEEYSLTKTPKQPVVLGDPQHLSMGLDVAYRNAPQSLREVEPTTGFKVR